MRRLRTLDDGHDGALLDSRRALETVGVDTTEKLRLQLHRIEGVGGLIVVGLDLSCSAQNRQYSVYVAWCRIMALGRALASRRMCVRCEAAPESQALLTRLDVLKSLVGHDCGVGRSSHAVRCELICVWGGGNPVDSAAEVRRCTGGTRYQTLGVRVEGSSVSGFAVVKWCGEAVGGKSRRILREDLNARRAGKVGLPLNPTSAFTVLRSWNSRAAGNLFDEAVPPINH